MATILALDIAADDFAVRMGFCMLSLILFIAVAGSLMNNGQWSWRFLIFMQVMCTAVPILAFVFDIMDLPFTLTLVILGGLMIVLTATNEVRLWIEGDRI
jgi:hypothetical protein